ncbi:uncharacterized protein LOC120330293 [Styela clava]
MPVFVANNSECNDQANKTKYTIKEEICVGNIIEPKSRFTNCLGNPGSFLICQRKTSCDWYLAGVKTSGKVCSGKEQEYAKFARISDVERSIEEIVSSKKQNEEKVDAQF